MNLSEIALAYKNCNGSVTKSFKEFLMEQNYTPEELINGITISKANDYILKDIDLLIDKAILNIGACDSLIKTGYFNWGFVTSYYSSFFSIQALNRFKLHFNTWVKSGVECQLINYLRQEILIKNSNSSGGSHESQINRFYENYSNFRNKTSVDRYWSIGISPFKMRPEAQLRNEINYQIEDYYFYELRISEKDFNKIIEDNKFDPSKRKISIKSPINYALPNLELALSRLRVCLYILNYLANANIEYKSYLIRNNEKRLSQLKTKYPDLSDWILKKIESWLIFEDIETDDKL